MTYSSKKKFITLLLSGVFSLAHFPSVMANYAINLDAEAAAKVDQLNPLLKAEYEKVQAIVHHMHHLGIRHHNHIAHKQLYRSAEGKYHVPHTQTHHYGVSHTEKVSHGHHNDNKDHYEHSSSAQYHHETHHHTKTHHSSPDHSSEFSYGHHGDNKTHKAHVHKPAHHSGQHEEADTTAEKEYADAAM